MKKAPRLVQSFRPSNYKLFIDLNRDMLNFNGNVKIAGQKVGRPANRLVLHQKGLKIVSAKIAKIDKKNNKVDINIIRINTHQKLNELRLHTSDTIYNGEYEIWIEFSGKITDPMVGLYPSRFNHAGKEKTILVTQFESHHAREVLPCIDEPEAKATFDVTISGDKNDVILSNMPELNTRNEKNKKIVTFMQTPKMSTYLLAFVAGELQFAQAKSKNGVLFRSWGSVAQPKNHLTYSAKEGAKLLDFYCDYFNTPFPLPKCDQVALPDFDAGAMENWGLITYREVALLVDPKNRSLSSEQYVSMVIAHELSHQWFGNLVTMKWWDYLWLNESFASIMEHIALDFLHPDWNQWEQYTISDVILASNRDVFADVQPVRAKVNHPDEVNGLFDPAIVYTKGARLLYMLREYIGDNSFRKGLKNYFKNHAYQNTTRDDLWTSLHQASNIQVKALMDPWLDQSGLPIVIVNKSGENTYELTQNRLLLDKTSSDQIWPLPLLANQKTEPIILKTVHHTVSTRTKLPLILNINSAGHYVVNYLDEGTKNYLKDSIKNRSLGAAARVNALNDLILISRSGQASIIQALEVLRASYKEDREAVWSMFARILGHISIFVEDHPSLEDRLYKLRRLLANDWYSKLGWIDQNADNTNLRLLRHTIVGTMIAGRDSDAIDYALNSYKKAKNCQDLQAEYRGVIMTAHVRHENPDLDDLLHQYKTATSPDVQIALCAGICEVSDSKSAKYVLRKTINKGGMVRTQDIFRWFVYLMRNQKTRELTWQWLKDNWERLENDMGPKMLDDLPGYAAGSLATKTWQNKYNKFFETKIKNPLLSRNIKIAMAEIESRKKWRDRELPLLQDYLNKV